MRHMNIPSSIIKGLGTLYDTTICLRLCFCVYSSLTFTGFLYILQDTQISVKVADWSMCLSDGEAFFLKDKKIILAWTIIIALFVGHISSCHCCTFTLFYIACYCGFIFIINNFNLIIVSTDKQYQHDLYFEQFLITRIQ